MDGNPMETVVPIDMDVQLVDACHLQIVEIANDALERAAREASKDIPMQPTTSLLDGLQKSIGCMNKSAIGKVLRRDDIPTRGLFKSFQQIEVPNRPPSNRAFETQEVPLLQSEGEAM
ncbi:hypothetical protein DYB32_008301 [Aphanomyces invadans]|uniref:Uncharacterized protein n=1 Tax=Aphanomyces invadans TaxID=157072 RepID=A0A418ALD3_9STRA|nr:hypothetical protein DYB32_008301 [Aphanomyces invadans]